MTAAADAGAKVFVLDVFFGIPVTQYAPDNDAYIAEAFGNASQKMPVVCAFVPEPWAPAPGRVRRPAEYDGRA